MVPQWRHVGRTSKLYHTNGIFYVVRYQPRHNWGADLGIRPIPTPLMNRIPNLLYSCTQINRRSFCLFSQITTINCVNLRQVLTKVIHGVITPTKVFQPPRELTSCAARKSICSVKKWNPRPPGARLRSCEAKAQVEMAI